MGEAGQRRFASLAAVQVCEMLRDIPGAVDRDDPWARMLPVVEHMDETDRGRMATAADSLDGEQLLRIAHARPDSASGSRPCRSSNAWTTTVRSTSRA